MDSKSPIGNRSSLSFSSINPMAESTQINAINLPNRFPWGGTVISPKKRDSAPSVTNGNMTYSNRNKGQISPISCSKIDPRVYTDIQSKGLTSRIVKYHEHSSRFNRSLSASSLYNKPGQFPVVHLKKTVIPYKANRYQNLSMVRIAPPEKSAFQGSTLSSILRSGSVVGISSGLQKCGEDLSHENRPILHPPATENEMAPTRSVLEVLKEISRKRINSDELDSNDSIKKHCKDYELDLQKSHHRTDSSKLLQQAIAPQNALITKRQRESHSSTISNQRSSPDQKVKKRLCRNNDITSSLSSSINLINSTKRKNDEYNLESPDSFRQPKQRCNDAVNKDDNLKSTQSYHSDPITPLPPTPAVCDSSDSIFVKPNLKLPEPIIDCKQKSPNKPKVTLFNRDYDSSKTRLITDDETTSCAIQFVKPKKNGSICSTKTSIQNAQKSKLALMLSGLKGELNDNRSDETDTTTKSSDTKKEESNESAVETSRSQTAATVSFNAVTTTTTSFNAVTTTITSPVITSKLLSTLQDKTSENILQSSIVNNIGTPLKPVEVADGRIETTQSTTIYIAPVLPTKTKVELKSANPSSNGGFKFQPSASTSLITAKSESVPILTGLTKTISTPSTSNNSLTNTLTNTCLAVTTTLVHNTSIANLAAVSSPSTQSFSFGAQPLVATTTTSSIIPLFSFGTEPKPPTMASTTSTSSSISSFSAFTSKSTPSISSLGYNSATTGQNLLQSSSAFSSITASSTLASVSPSSFVGTTSHQNSDGFVCTSLSSKLTAPVFGSDFNNISKNSDLAGTTIFNSNKNCNQSQQFGLVKPSFENTFGNTTKSPITPFGNITSSTGNKTDTVFKAPLSTNAFKFGSNGGKGDSNTTSAGGFSFPTLPKTSTISSTSTSFVFTGANTMMTPLSTDNKSTFSSSTKPPSANQAAIGDTAFGSQPNETKSVFGGSSIPTNSNFSIFGQTNNRLQNSSEQTLGSTASNMPPTTTAFVFGSPSLQKTEAQNNFSFNTPINSANNKSVNSPLLNSIQLKSASNNVFGAISLPNNSQNSINFNFGGNSTQSTSKPSIFGSSNAAIANVFAKPENNNKNLFGGFDSTANNLNVSSARSSVTQSNNVFGTSSALSSPFGSTAQSKGFSFGSAATSNNSVNNSFIFNGSNQSKPDSNLHSFGQTLSLPATTTLSTQNPFLANNAQQLVNNAEMNSMPMAGQSTNERPIKKATRRLNK